VLFDYQTIVDDLVRDDAGKITPLGRDCAIATAVTRYSDDKPGSVVEDIAATGDDIFPMPTAWEAEFSRITSIEYPIGNTNPDYVTHWSIYSAPGGDELRIAGLESGTTVRVAHTVSRVVDETTDTIQIRHRQIVAAYAAALLCEQLAAVYSGDSDSTIQADSVDHSDKARRFRELARGYMKRYFDGLGIDPKKNNAAGAVVSMRQSTGRGGSTLRPNRFL